MQKELDTSIPCSRKESVDFRKLGFNGSMIFVSGVWGYEQKLDSGYYPDWRFRISVPDITLE